MNVARARAEDQIRAAIAAAEQSAARELDLAALCTDPDNVEMRRANALIQQEIAADYRRALAEHLLLDGIVYCEMPELVQ
jgi:hypothetical protein